MVVGAPDAQIGPTTGLVHVLRAVDAVPLHVIRAQGADALGASIACVPDMDGDGLPDMLAGAPAAGAGGLLIVTGLDGPGQPLLAGEGFVSAGTPTQFVLARSRRTPPSSW